MVLITRPRPQNDAAARPNARDYSHAYHSILLSSRRASGGAGAAGASSAVLLLVKPDVDGVCAARALAGLLREDEVAHRVVPVDGYAALERVIREDVVGNEELHTLILLNLGSLLSLPSYFREPDSDPEEEDGIPLPSNCTLHLIDSHRPYNLDNLFATSTLVERVHVWDDGDVEERMVREAEAYEKLEFEVEHDDEDSDSEHGSETDSEDGSDEDEEQEREALLGFTDDEDEDASQSGKRRKRRRLGTGEEGSEGEEGDSSSEAEPRSRRRRRAKRQKAARTSAAELAQHRAVIARYYARGTGFGLPCSLVMWMLAERLGRGGNEGLWLAILGLTAQYLSTSIPTDSYHDLASLLASDVRALNPSLPNATGSGANASGGLAGKAADADDGRIRVLDQELRFTLYRHWSLENAMYHSAYVAGKLSIWREKGVAKLRGLMAKMGFSLAQCRQTFDHMDLDLRRALTSRIESIAPEYGLTECVYASFLRSFGYQSSAMSAADAVEGLTALLTAAHGVRIDVDAPGMTFAGMGVGAGGQRGAYGAATGEGQTSSEMFVGKRAWNLGGRTDNKEKSTDADDDEEDADGAKSNEADWVRNFFSAYNSLDSRKPASVALLRTSLSLSKSLHRAIISQGVALIDKQAIKTLRSFRLAILKDGPDLALFTHPSTLTRLALWLVDALRDIVAEQEERAIARKRSRKAAKGAAEDETLTAPHSMPFVLAALDEAQDRYLVVGVTGAIDFGDTRRNRFGLAFSDAANKSGARTRHDKFETSAVEVKKDDLPEFIEALHMKA